MNKPVSWPLIWESEKGRIELTPAAAGKPNLISRAQAAMDAIANEHTTRGIEICREILAEDPRHPEALHLLGVAHFRQGNHSEAIRRIEEAIRLAPGVAHYHNNLATVLGRHGRRREAIASYERAIALAPERSDYHAHRANCLAATNQYEAAVSAYRRALALEAGDAGIYRSLSVALYRLGKQSEALAVIDIALELDPNLVSAKWARCMMQALSMYDTENEIPRARRAYTDALAELARSLPLDRPSERQEAFDAISYMQPFYLPYMGANDRELQRTYGELVCRILSARYPAWSRMRPARHAGDDERIRVGIVSAFFYEHSNWKILLHGWVMHHDRERFALHCYHTGPETDERTRNAIERSHRFVQGPRLHEDWCRTILEDELDVLIYAEVGMDPTAVSLAGLRLAPVQCASWGHPNTTGLPTIDYFLSADLMEPDEGADHYTETLIRLPNLSTQYARPPTTADGCHRRADFGLPEEAVVYLSSQSLFKYLPRHDDIFARIAGQVPGCRIVFLRHQRSRYIDERFFARLERAFAARRLDAGEHVVLVDRMDVVRFQGLNRICDVYLDSIGWCGNSTTLEGLAAGLPVVTLPGRLMRARHSLAILTLLDLTETVAADAEDYVRIAAHLGQDVEWREKIKAEISRKLPSLYADPAPIRGLERFLDTAVRASRDFEGEGTQPVPESVPDTGTAI